MPDSDLVIARFGAIRQAAVKRLVDVAGAVVLLVILSPVFAVCALLVRIDSPGPIFFRQQRIGQGGRQFSMLKFRSMYADADASPHETYTAAFIRGTAAPRAAGQAAMYKLAGDRRVTRVGGWLRRTSLDELPQLWNVLVGEMSLVGPRPPLAYEVRHYQPRHMDRLAAKPGMTGLWQVSGRSRTTFEEMVALDLHYIQNQSLLLDLSIMARTIPVVLFRSDAR
jgi:exopolysaccharide biosynthesis polyprenyl glycosylphosphotransferase